MDSINSVITHYNSALTLFLAFGALIISLFYAITTTKMAKETTALRKETAELRKIETTPHIVVYIIFEPHRVTAFDIIISNVGRGPAYDINFNILCDESILRSKNVMIVDVELFRHVDFLPQGEKLRMFFGSAIEMLEQPKLEAFIIETSYRDKEGNKYEEKFNINISAFENVKVLTSSVESDISRTLKEIEKAIKALSRNDS
ncbi:MAG: hypothetical protein GC191_04345 [Azospirillum sp.]|nr:hypothetical protein [Azospirillum sp.]